MSHTISEPTFTGYISSTHDALIIFECVRRGIMPKVSRRLRDDERRLIRSGSVFVFDERESGIKRWTDGLLWSPSRILWNFLVYRQIEKKSSKTSDSSRVSNGNVGTPGELSIDPLAHGVSYMPGTNSGPSSLVASPSGSAFPDARDFGGGGARGRSISSASDSAASWRNTNFMDPRYGHQQSQMMAPSLNTINAGAFSASVPMPQGGSGGMMERREADLERALVGSLKSSYPFAKDGLCKKTISIQVEGSTQHLISYYKVDDVRSGRLRTPVSLPEISGLNISPILLNKSNFRNPPDIEFLPDGSVRYRGDGSEPSRRSNGGTGSGSDGTSGSEGRSFHGSSYSSGAPLSPTSSEALFPPIGGAGMDSRLGGNQQMSSGGSVPRRLSGTFGTRTHRAYTTGRYEPYAVPPMYGVSRGDPPLRPGMPSGNAGASTYASSSSWTPSASHSNRLEGHQTSNSRQAWQSQYPDPSQYLRDNAPWQTKAEEGSFPQSTHWNSSSGVVKPLASPGDGGHRFGDPGRMRGEARDPWSQSQMPVSSGHGSTAGSDGTAMKPSVLQPHVPDASEQANLSSTDSLSHLSSQYGSDFSSNRSFNAMSGHTGIATPSKLQNNSGGHHHHHSMGTPQEQSQQLPQSVGEYSHGPMQNTWSDTPNNNHWQHQSLRGGEGPDMSPSQSLNSNPWATYSAHSGLTQAQDSDQSYGDVSGQQGSGPRSGLGTVLLTRPDPTHFRPTFGGPGEMWQK